MQPLEMRERFPVLKKLVFRTGGKRKAGELGKETVRSMREVVTWPGSGCGERSLAKQDVGLKHQRVRRYVQVLRLTSQRGHSPRVG